MFQYYAMLSGGKCARLFGFRSEGGGGGGGRGGTSNPFIDRNAVKEAGVPGGRGGNKYASQTLHAKFHTPVKHNLMSGRSWMIGFWQPDNFPIQIVFVFNLF